MKTNHSLSVIRWIARIIALFFILTMLLIFFGQILDGGGPPLEAWIGILFMPIGVVVGLALAWKWEGLGGLVVLLSLIDFHLFLIVRDGMFRFISFADLTIIPAILFLAYWYLTKRRTR